MPRITRISPQQQNPDRLSIYIDGVFCTGIRSRTFAGMGLDIGSEITCEKIKELENFFWKKSYGEEAWKKEKVRLKAVQALVEGIHNNLLVTTVGFGADTDALIERHPDEKGKPDLDVSLKETPHVVLIKIEVTGTESMRGVGYWVRPDKLEYAENHPNEDVWIVLHYAEPNELFIFIKPVAHKKYKRHTIEIRGAGEHMCIFNDGDEELKTYDQFKNYVLEKFGLNGV